jgi:hypothetical protein
MCKKVPKLRGPLKKSQVEAWSEKNEIKQPDVNNVFAYTRKPDPDVVKADPSRMRIEEPEDDGPEVNEWKLAAEIIDRFFLFLYVVITCCVNVITLFIMPILARESIEQ